MRVPSGRYDRHRQQNRKKAYARHIRRPKSIVRQFDRVCELALGPVRSIAAER